MQGVNVVARWIDPTTHQASRRYAVSSVSGFAFRGNGGNPITGFDDSIGDALAEWGSTNSSAEGFCDMAGLAPPTSGAQYQLSVEAIDPKWPAGVGPYSPGPVSPSGSFSPITVTVSPGGDLQQDILMIGSARPLSQSSSSWTSPLPLPLGGDWGGSFVAYPPGTGAGETNSGNPAMPVILKVTQNDGSTDSNGLASVTPVPPGRNTDVRKVTGAASTGCGEAAESTTRTTIG